jgi:pimeloyl-ACP methyl ester carboxylesterase
MTPFKSYAITAIVACFTSALLPAVNLPARAADAPPDGYRLKDFGSFYVGGRQAAISGKPVKEIQFTPGGAPARVDPNGDYQIGQMYVQYFVPLDAKGAVPLLLWHGGGLTGVTYETTPDGRPGWLQNFVADGWTVYNSDSMERGRSGFPPPDLIKGEPVFLTTANPFERFRIGQGPGSWNDDPAKRRLNPGSQFPIEAYANLTKEIVPRWLTTDEDIIAAYREEVARVCPCVILVHSQGGQFGFKVAQEMPDKVKALVAVEPAAIGYADKAAALKNVPVLMVFGDYIEGDPRWVTMRQRALDFGAAIKGAGGSVEVYDLPKVDIHGNSHVMMMDRNSRQIADLIDAWLAKQGLKR